MCGPNTSTKSKDGMLLSLNNRKLHTFHMLTSTPISQINYIYIRYTIFTQVVRVLVAAGASLLATNYGGWTALHHAAFVGHAALCELLVDEGAPVNVIADSYTPLRMARHEHISSATFGGGAVAAASTDGDERGGEDANGGTDEVWRRKGDFVSKGREACAAKIEAAGGLR